MPNPPNFKPGVGRLATDRYDFESHLEGKNPTGFTNFRHTADQTDMNPPVIGGATTVQASLSNVAAFIASQSGIGQGFITVGDGYDTWHLANGTNNFDPSVPALDSLLNPIFNAIYTNSGVPNNFTRIQRGGIVIIKAGTYIVKHTINVPPGIVIIGEGYGTKIINATNLNTSVSPPIANTPIQISNISGTSPLTVTTATTLPASLVTNDTVNISGANGPDTLNPAFGIGINSSWQITVTGSNTFTLNNSNAVSGSFSGTAFCSTMAPVFRILPDNARAINDAAVDTNMFVFSRETKIMNLVICDNFIENTQIGDLNYKTPQNQTSSTFLYPPPLIFQANGSSLILDDVVMMGRAAYISGVVSRATGAAVGLDTTNPAPGGTLFRMTNSVMDGFSTPIFWLNTSGSADYMEVSNSKIRGYGYYNGDGSTNFFNNLFCVNDCDLKVTGNLLYGNYTNITRAVFVNTTIASPPVLQARAKMLVASNDIVIDKVSSFSGSNSNVTFNAIEMGSTFNSYITWMTYGNTLQGTFKLNVDGTDAIASTSTTTTVGSLTTGSISNTGTLVSAGHNTFGNVTSFGHATDPGYSTSGVYSDVPLHINQAVYMPVHDGIGNTTYNVTDSDYLIVISNSGGSSTVNLPSAASNHGRVLIIKVNGNSDPTLNYTTVVPFGSEWIDDPANTQYILNTPFTSITLVAGNGGYWYIV